MKVSIFSPDHIDWQGSEVGACPCRTWNLAEKELLARTKRNKAQLTQTWYDSAQHVAVQLQ